MTTLPTAPPQADWGDGKNLITNSSVKAFQKCPFLYYMRYQLGIQSVQEKKALRFGGNWHLGLELLGNGQTLDAVLATLYDAYEHCPDHIDATDWQVEYYTLASCLAGYVWWNEAQPATEVVRTEILFNLSINNPATGHASTKWRMGGKIDKIVLVNGRLKVREHKTTSDSIDPTSDYWSRLRLDNQISFYVLAARMAGYDVDGVDYDVLHKPQIKPAMLTQGESKDFVVDGRYYGATFPVTVTGSCKAGDLAVTVDGLPVEVKIGAEPKPTKANPTPHWPFAIKESPRMFGARVFDEITHVKDDKHKGPGYYFARRDIARTEADLEAFRYELWSIMQTINEMTVTKRFYRNADSCIARGSAKCDYTGICFNQLDPLTELPPEYTRIAFVHPELAEGLDTVQDYVTETRDSPAVATQGE